MTENKWQHFVPQFYFRYFSEDYKNIFGYHLKSKTHYKSLIVRQSAKNYFYSKNPEIDKSFSHLEAQFNNVLKKIIGKDNFIELTSEEYMEMLRFISFQGNRTEKAKKLSDDFVAKFVENAIKPLMKSNKELMSKVTEKDIDELNITHPGAFLFGIVHSLESNILLTDLVPALIINRTDNDFIFSDNPIIFYNLIYRDPNHSFEGMQSPGLIILCPVSTKKCLLLFDPVYYSIDLDNKNTLEIDNLDDITSINKLQFHNSFQNIYYSSENQKDIIDNISKDYFSKYSKEDNLANIREIPKWDGGNNSLLITSRKGIPEKINLKFIKCAKPLREVSVIRNIKLIELLEERMELYGLKKNH